MKRGARLGLKSSLSPSTPPTDVPPSDITNSASLAKAEREIKALQEENKKLRDDFSEISTMYHQLVRESSHEKYDERRVIALKAQIIQLERQLMTLAEAQGTRAGTLMEVENALAGIADCARSHLVQENAVGSNVGSISLPRSQLTSIVETAESARIKMYKSIECSNPEKLQRPLLMMDRFVKQSPHEPVTLMDVCSGKLEHLNLKHVSKLESQLAQLYKQLMLVNKSLFSITNPEKKQPSREVPTVLYERLGAEVSHACNQLNTVTRDLLDLTLLVPAAPWPPLQRPRIQDLTTDDVIRVLPSFPRSKAAEGRHLIEALLKYHTFSNHMIGLENQILSEELKFHQCVYDLQQEYVQSLFSAVRDGYAEFEENTNKLICHPLLEILKNYSVLRNDASEEALREFLAVFKQHADQLEDAVNIIKPDEKRTGDDGKAALSEFGNQFTKSLNHIHKECQKKRDKLISDLEEVKALQQGHTDEMKELFERAAVPDPREEYEEITGKITEIDPRDVRVEDEKNKVKPTPSKKDGEDARGKRRGSLKSKPKGVEGSECNCGIDEGANNGHDQDCGVNGTPASSQSQRPSARRPASIGDLTSRRPSDLTSRRTPPTPRTSRLPSRSVPTTPSSSEGPPPPTPSSSRIPAHRARGSLIPGASPAMLSRGRTPPGGRLTPLNKLTLKPRVDREASPGEGQGAQTDSPGSTEVP